MRSRASELLHVQDKFGASMGRRSEMLGKAEGATETQAKGTWHVGIVEVASDGKVGAVGCGLAVVKECLVDELHDTLAAHLKIGGHVRLVARFHLFRGEDHFDKAPMAVCNPTRSIHALQARIDLDVPRVPKLGCEEDGETIAGQQDAHYSRHCEDILQHTKRTQSGSVGVAGIARRASDNL